MDRVKFSETSASTVNNRLPIYATMRTIDPTGAQLRAVSTADEGKYGYAAVGAALVTAPKWRPIVSGVAGKSIDAFGRTAVGSATKELGTAIGSRVSESALGDVGRGVADVAGDVSKSVAKGIGSVASKVAPAKTNLLGALETGGETAAEDVAKGGVLDALPGVGEVLDVASVGAGLYSAYEAYEKDKDLDKATAAAAPKVVDTTAGASQSVQTATQAL